MKRYVQISYPCMKTFNTVFNTVNVNIFNIVFNTVNININTVKNVCVMKIINSSYS